MGGVIGYMLTWFFQRGREECIRERGVHVRGGHRDACGVELMQVGEDDALIFNYGLPPIFGLASLRYIAALPPAFGPAFGPALVQPDGEASFTAPPEDQAALLAALVEGRVRPSPEV